MDLDVIGRALLPASPVLVTAGLVWLSARLSGQLRRRLRADVATLDRLPAGSMARAALETHVVWQADRLHRRESTGERDIGRVITGVFLAVGFGHTTIWLLDQPHWWRWAGLVTLFLAFAGLRSIHDGLQVAPRRPRHDRSGPGATVLHPTVESTEGPLKPR